jgi:transposase
MGRDGKMDVQLDVSRGGYAGRVEVIEGPTGRRWRSDVEKARIVAESLAPGVRVADVARRHGTTRWQVYDWRRRVRDGRLALPESLVSAPVFAALVVEEPAPSGPAKSGPAKSGPAKSGPGTEGIEVVLGDVVIRAGRDAEEAHLSRVIRAVRAAG